MVIPVIAAIMIGAGAFAPAMAEPASVADPGCNGGFTIGFGFSSYTVTDERVVSSNNAKDNSSASCHGVLDDLGTAPDKAFRATFVASWTDGDGEDHVGDCKITVTPDGAVNLFCNDN